MKKLKQGIDWNNSRIFDFLIEVLILIVVFIMPTIFDRRLGIVFSGTKTTWMRFFGALILGVWAIKILVGREHRFFRTPLDWPVVSFLLCTTIATLTSVNVYTSFAGFYGRYEGLTSWYLFGLFFFVITNYIRSFDQLKRVLVTVVSAGTLMAVYSIVQRHGVDPYMWGGVITWQRVIGTIGQPNFMAAYMLMAFFLTLALILMEKPSAFSKSAEWYDQLFPIGCFLFVPAAFLVMIFNLEANNFVFWYFAFSLITASALLFAYTYERLHPRILNIVFGLSLVLIYVSILYTQSRGGYMGFFTGAVLFALAAGRHCIFGHWKKIVVLGFLVVLVSGITMARPEFSPFARFATEITAEKIEGEEPAAVETKLELRGAAGSRGETWKSAFGIIADHPFFGIGPEVMKMVFPRYETDLFRFKETFHVKQDRCHNETFDVGVTKGLVTFLVYLWLLFTLFRVGFDKVRGAQGDQRVVLAGLLGAALAFLIQNQFSFGVVAITSLFWMIWAMIMVVGEEAEGQRPEARGKKISWAEIPWLAVAAVVALVIFVVYVSFFSFRGDIWFKSGKTKMEMRRVPQAVEDFERSLSVFPFEGGTVSHLGIAYLNFSQTAPQDRKAELMGNAISTLQYGTQIDPYNADNFFMLSRIYFILYRMGDRRALENSQRYAEIALKIDPYYAEVYHILGLIYENQGRIKEAAWNMEKAFNVNPGLEASMQDLENLYRRMGKTGETIKVMDRFLEKYGESAAALERMARLYLELGKTEKTLEIAERIIKIDPKSSPGHILRAIVHGRRGQIDRAFSDLQTVVLNDPKNVVAHNELGRLYLMTGNKEKAREEFEGVLMLDSGNAFARTMLERIK
jgi:tetratricopeptide (TPR) repeat protein/O-antigen ligase